MRGHQAIKELRRMGKKPTHVFVFLQAADDAAAVFVDPEDMLSNGLLPEVRIAPTETLTALDFRFLHGVTVHLQGACTERLRAAYSEIIRVRPSRVIVSGPGAFHDTGLRQ